ncbi:MAG: ABC transporter substrate binding protein [Arcobacteraceae bacterium]
MKFIVTIVCLFFFHTHLFATTTKNVLILNSYHKGFEFSDTIIKNIEELFYKDQNINLSVLYMNSKQISTREYRKKLHDLYSLQLKNKTYDLIITIDRFAYKFAVKNYKHLFSEEKILFIGIEQYSKELAKIYQLKDKINGIIQKLAIEQNIEIIRKVIPNLETLYILNDRSPNANDSSEFIINAIQKIKKDVHVEYLRDYTLTELKEYFKTFKKNQAILFVRFSLDIHGEYYKTNDVAAAIKEFNLPVFATDSLFLGKGIVGGKLISTDNLGVLTGQFAINLLNNKIKSPHVKTYTSYQNVFDYEQIKRFQLIIPRTLKGFDFINTPEGFFDKHRTFINNVFLATPLLLIIIFGLSEALYAKQQATKKLKQRLDFDYALLNAIDSPIFWQDKYGKILDINKNFCELVNLEYETLIGKNLYHIEQKSIYIQKIIRFLQSDFTSDVNFYIKDKDGNKKIFYIKQTSFESVNSESGIVTIFTDITKEKKIEQDREKEVQYLVQQSKMAEMGEIFSSIAHQWKSPLVAITALAQDMFYSSNSSEKEEDSYHIKNIMIQANYMADTINDFQDFIIPSKEKTVFNVHDTIKNMFNIVQHNMKYNYINITIKAQENAKLDIYGYENEFMQAVLNILNNAKDALLQNNEKNRNLTIELRNRYNLLVIDIIDNGPGIKAQDKKKIFQQYFSTKQTGHGIGLYMTKLIIQDKFHGKIYYKNPKVGSYFRILLKLDENKGETI